MILSAARGNRAAQRGSAAAELRGARVLCIDDDPDVCRGIELRLRNDGVDVTCAYFGTQGLWLAMTSKPDVVITDIGMPSGSGDYIVECLKRNAQTRRIPLLVLSGRKDDAMRHRLLSLGVERWLTKPIRHDDLIAVLRPLVRPATAARPPGRADEERSGSCFAG
ncbi:MAG TPA: response regulator [Pirellulales bacterium]|jgi:DNA-binding response OmpR family regulator|nr:response regulator [Pirellulales bacterium]